MSAQVIPFRTRPAPTRPPTNDPALAFIRAVRPEMTDAQILGTLDRIARAWNTARAAHPDAFCEIEDPPRRKPKPAG
jgi:hypothetical protein